MKQYIRCKVCGFVMDESKLGAVCPACGVKREMFIPDTEKLSETRRKILDSHIHPIVVHFPQSMPALLFLAGVVVLLGPTGLKSDLTGVIRMLAVCLPFVVAGGFVSGLIDGKVRFRKVTTPILRLKMIAGAAFFVCSCAGAYVPYSRFELTTAGIMIFLIIQFLCIVCNTALGRWGTSILNSKFPG